MRLVVCLPAERAEKLESQRASAFSIAHCQASVKVLVAPAGRRETPGSAGRWGYKRPLLCELGEMC